MSSGVIQDIVYVIALIGIGIPLGLYIYKVIDREAYVEAHRGPRTFHL